ncbi:MAG TPA: 30S ribosomal protein S12 methylthiotransferase RimO [Vicinamibacterales bacterium]|nr:30S ribosomal protein S12 methylthiotransferase RimO [Vicinamibacterales bacterium]
MKIGFVSLGCPKNLVDGEVMLGIARDAGHEIIADASSADVLVVNTCAFIDSAKQESIDAILEMAAQKRDGRCSRLVVTGCLAERYRDELKKEIPEIDALLGTGEVEGIVEAVGGPGLGTRDSGLEDARPRAVPLKFFAPTPTAERFDSRAPAPEHRAPAREAPSYIYDADTPRLLTTPRHFAYVKIAEGCDYTCAFCIIPTLRGSYRSRTAASIVREARALAERGVRELLLISQDTTFYGIDRSERGALARLLRELNAIDGLRWIRLLYLYPTTITDDVLAAMAECEKVCRYVDLPLQHASADVLKRMRRPGNRKTYDALLSRIRARVPDVTLRTTFIVGFPGETDADFAELESFVADTGFDHVGVFTYSHEEGTRAFGLADDVTAAVKTRRRNGLMARQKKIVARAHRARIGTDVDLLVDGPSPDHPMVLQGRLEGQAPDIDSVVYLTDCDPSGIETGQLIRARIVAARGYDLVAAPYVHAPTR